MKILKYALLFFGGVITIAILDVLFAWPTTYEISCSSHINWSKGRMSVKKNFPMEKNKEYTFTIHAIDLSAHHIRAQYDESVMTVSFDKHTVQQHEDIEMTVVFLREVTGEKMIIMTDCEEYNLTIWMSKPNMFGEWLRKH